MSLQNATIEARRALFQPTIDAAIERRDALRSYFSVTSIDAWPYVVVRKAPGLDATALKLIDKTADSFRYNFSAQGRDATQFPKDEAFRIAQIAREGRKDDDADIFVAPKREFFAEALAEAERTIAAFETIIETGDWG